MENWRIPWIEEIRGFDVKFWRSIDLGVKNSEVLELSVKYQNLSLKCLISLCLKLLKL